jgi:hypothetical protein
MVKVSANLLKEVETIRGKGCFIYEKIVTKYVSPFPIVNMLFYKNKTYFKIF